MYGLKERSYNELMAILTSVPEIEELDIWRGTAI